MEEPYRKEDNHEAWTAWQCVTRTSVNVFLTGRAGTGKTTFLKRLREQSLKRMVVVAPTGVAAINAGGVTIHSFFQLPFSPYIPGTKPKQDFNIRKQKLYIIRTMDLLVIDEISMVRADLLDAIDAQLRLLRRSHKPFGGVQLLMIGDLQQLAPVVQDNEFGMLSQYYSTNYFFGSLALRQTQYLTVELQRVYRQSDEAFVALLNKVRDNKMDPQSLQTLNSRYVPNFRPADGERYIRLTTHNSQADTVNQQNLSMISGKERTYDCTVVDKFPEALYPADAHLTLKVGAQVMFIKNDKQAAKRFFNGKIGVVVALRNDVVVVNCDDEQGDIEVSQDEWQNVSYEVDPKTNEIVEKVEGVFRQIPLRLAWAITIHKSQGLTFDHAIIDAANSFSHGQVYVALSRCRTFEGMVLSSPIPQSAIIPDDQISAFISQQSANRVTDDAIEGFALEYCYDVIDDLFGFDGLLTPSYRLMTILQEHYSKAYPKLIADIKLRISLAQNEIDAVSRKFMEQCYYKKSCQVNPQADVEFSARIVNGCKYFLQKLSSTVGEIASMCDISLDNQQVNKQYGAVLSHLADELKVKEAMLKAVAQDGFSVKVVASAKIQALSNEMGVVSSKEIKPSTTVRKAASDVRNVELYDKLKAWRAQEASKLDKPAYIVFSDKILIEIANMLPTTLTELSSIRGIGANKVKRYAETIIQLVTSYKKHNGLPDLNGDADADDASSVMDKTTQECGQAQIEEPKKEKTQETTLRLFNRLHSVEEVAKERNLKVSTILGHLFSAAAAGLVDIDSFFPAERRKRLETLVRNSDSDSSEYLKSLVNMGFHYDEIRYVRSQIESEKMD